MIASHNPRNRQQQAMRTMRTSLAVLLVLLLLTGVCWGEATKRDLHYRYTVDIEEEVDEGGPHDNDGGPSNDTVVCIESSMASHMDKMAEVFMLEVDGYHQIGREWSIDRIFFSQNNEKISLTVQNHIMAKLKMFLDGELTFEKKIRLEENAAGHGRYLVHNVDATKKIRKKRKKRRTRRRKFSLNNKGHCRNCLADDADARRRTLKSGSFIRNVIHSVTFETWMNIRIQEVIQEDCSLVTIFSTTFSRIENGQVTHTSGPYTPVEQEADLEITTYGTMSPSYAPTIGQPETEEPSTTQPTFPPTKGPTESPTTLPATAPTISPAIVSVTSPKATRCSSEISVNGGFEDGNLNGWTQFPSPGSTQTVGSGVPFNPTEGNFAAKVVNPTRASGSVIKNANLGMGLVKANDPIAVSFDARADVLGPGALVFAEFFSELSGGGTSREEILGGGPILSVSNPGKWKSFSFSTTTGTDVSGGVTLQFVVVTGGNQRSKATAYFDNVSIRVGHSCSK